MDKDRYIAVWRIGRGQHASACQSSEAGDYPLGCHSYIYEEQQCS